MPCYHPLSGFRSREVNLSGKRSIVFSANQGYRDLPVTVPCGQCIGCRLERSRNWAVRCVHESSLYEKNCFLTLTYNDKNLPKNLSLNKSHFQKFLKRLRKKYPNETIRYFHCGEYGEQFARPHYHACIFGFDFPDKELFKLVNGNKLYVSQELDKIWGMGFATIGDVTFESAAYVARYITKKVTGKRALEHYNTIDYQTGEILNERTPEYTTMSRRPGIGKGWFEKYAADVFPDDFVLSRGKKIKTPKYYNSLYEFENPERYEKIKNRRLRAAALQASNNTRERLDAREEIQLTKLKQLKRTLE